MFAPDYDKPWEDIHVLTTNSNGQDLGWPSCEGPCDNPDFSSTCNCNQHDDPWLSYKHTSFNNRGEL